MTKTQLAEQIADRCFPTDPRGLGFRQLTRRTRRQLEEQLAEMTMTREQRQASYRRYWNSRGYDY